MEMKAYEYKGYVFQDTKRKDQGIVQDFQILDFSDDEANIHQEVASWDCETGIRKLNISITGTAFALLSWAKFKMIGHTKYKLYIYLREGNIFLSRHIAIDVTDDGIRIEAGRKLSQKEIRIINAINDLDEGKTLDQNQVIKLLNDIPTQANQLLYLKRCRERREAKEYYEQSKLSPEEIRKRKQEAYEILKHREESPTVKAEA